MHTLDTSLFIFSCCAKTKTNFKDLSFFLMKTQLTIRILWKIKLVLGCVNSRTRFYQEVLKVYF